jgi:hypothetical protein
MKRNMKRHIALSAFLLAACFAAGTSAQVVGYNFRSGDVWVDSQLGYINDYGRRDRTYFVDDIVSSFGAPRYLVNDLLDKRRWEPGDVYYAAALAYTARRPFGDITRDYEQNRGQGWGVIAQRMGIKPGSAEFHALKGRMGKDKGRYEARGPGLGGPGNSGKGHGDNGNKGKDHQGDDHGGKGKGEHDKGNGGKGKSKGHGH